MWQYILILTCNILQQKSLLNTYGTERIKKRTERQLSLSTDSFSKPLLTQVAIQVFAFTT